MQPEDQAHNKTQIALEHKQTSFKIALTPGSGMVKPRKQYHRLA